MKIKIYKMKKIITITTIIILALTLIIGLWIYYPFGKTFPPHPNDKLTSHLNGENKDVNYETINADLELKNIQEIYTIDKLDKNSYFVQGEYVFKAPPETNKDYLSGIEENKSYLMGVHYNVSENNISVEAIRHIAKPERAHSTLYEKSDGSLNSIRIAYQEYAIASPTGAPRSGFGNTVTIEQNDKICTQSETNQSFETLTCENPEPVDNASLVIYNRKANYHKKISKLPLDESPRYVIDTVKEPTGVLKGNSTEANVTLKWKKVLTRNASNKIKLNIEDVHKTKYGELKLGYVLQNDATENSVYNRRSIVTNHVYGPDLSAITGNLSVNLSDMIENQYNNPANSKNKIILKWTLIGFDGSDWKVIKESEKVKNQPIPTMLNGASETYRKEKGKVDIAIRLKNKDEKRFLKKYNITVSNQVDDLLFIKANASDLRKISLEYEVSYIRNPVKPTVDPIKPN